MADRDIRVIYRDGQFVPLDPVEYEDGSAFTITVRGESDAAAQRREDVVRAARGAWKGLVDPDELVAHLRQRRLISTRPEPKLWDGGVVLPAEWDGVR